MPGVNGQVVGSPALQASMSMLSLAPAASTVGWLASTATVGSFCLFWEKGAVGLPTETSLSPPGCAEAIAGAIIPTTSARKPATTACRPSRMAYPSFGGTGLNLTTLTRR
jgi:hypothetical protein